MTIPAQLQHYRILGPLGKGGMGEVFAAEDAKLHRKVAIKVLPGLMAADAERRHRFEREAQAIAALNHPNIVTIHAVEEADGVPFIVMELVEGQPLSDLIKAGGLPLETLLRIGTAISDAIGAAHQRGITHRDLKPANVMIGHDGRVKVLDFGLAKLREAEAEYDGETMLPQSDLTGEGRIIGTVAYMSPEQAEGKAVDPRSDIFSLGVMLHEMAVGQRPFQGDTNVSVISSILKDTPASITDLNPALPTGLAKVIRRSLSKDASRRYQTAIDLRNELEELKQDFDSGMRTMTSSISRPTVTRDSSRGTLAIAGALLLAVVLGGGGWYLWKGRAAPVSADFVADKVQRLTTSGVARMAAISGDGKYVVHIKTDGQAASLWTRQTAAASDVQIVAPAAMRYDGLAFSPDGNYVYYSTYDLTGGVASLFRVPVLGGTPERVLEDIDSRVTFSPDHQQFAFIRGVPGVGRNNLMIASVDGNNVRSLGAPAGLTRLMLDAPAWSPDGRTIVAPAQSLDQGPHGVYVTYDVATGVIKEIGGRWIQAGDCAWLPDGRSFLAVATDWSSPQSAQIWQIAFPSGQTRRVTLDLNSYQGVTVSSDGVSIATVQSEVTASLSVAAAGDLTKSTMIAGGRARADGLQGMAWTADGRLVYGSTASGNSHIWIADADGSNARQITTGDGFASQPITPLSGGFVVYQLFRNNSIHLYRTALDGSDTRQITKGPGEFNPALSPDGKWLYYGSFGNDRGRVLKISTDGGEPVVLAESGSFNPIAVSPDGSQLLGSNWDEANRRSSYALLPTAGGSPRNLGIAVVGRADWSADGKSIVYLDYVDGQLTMMSRDLSQPAPKPIGRFGGDRVQSFAWSRDGQRVALGRGTFSSDVVLLSRK